MIIIALFGVGISIIGQQMTVLSYPVKEEVLKEGRDFVDAISQQIVSGYRSQELTQTDKFYYYYEAISVDGSKTVYTNTTLEEIKKQRQVSPESIYYNSEEPFAEKNETADRGHIVSETRAWLLTNHFSEEESGYLYFVVNPDYAQSIYKLQEQRNAEYLAQYDRSTFIIMVLIVSLLFLTIPLTIIIWMQTQKRPDKIKGLDNWYTEIQVITLFTCVGIFIALLTTHVNPIIQDIFIIFMAICNFLFVLLGELLYCSMVKKIKYQTFLSQSLCSKLISGIAHNIATIFDKKELSYTQKINAYLYMLIMALVGLALFCLVLAGFLGSIGSAIFIGMIGIITIILSYQYQIKILTYNIDAEVKTIVEEQTKAERMKLELITNVSHDLKTPITSLVSYLDLLSDEKLKAPADEYVEILQAKTSTLTSIVNDLFDLAKATSGNLEVQLEKINLASLINQSMVDLEDAIKQSRMKIKADLQEDTYIYADGIKMHRVFVNLLDNALKYSNKKTRVYLKLFKEAEKIHFTIQNTANYEMEFTAAEITERFVRGDESRTTEGSGLGLSIAKSFTELSGGTFAVNIDGDQFKIELIFPKYQENESPSSV